MHTNTVKKIIAFAKAEVDLKTPIFLIRQRREKITKQHIAIQKEIFSRFQSGLAWCRMSAKFSLIKKIYAHTKPIYERHKAILTKIFPGFPKSFCPISV